jgi:hypothetical protein
MTPFRLTAPEIPEADIHEMVASLLERIIPPDAAVEWACYPAGLIKLTAAQMARLTRAGLKSGWPDLIILHDGIYGIELKRRSGRLSQDRITQNKRGTPRLVIGQETRFPRLTRAGMREIAVCHSPEEVVAALKRWRIPLRGRIAA